MGDMSEYRGLIVVITFAAVTLLLIGLAVSQSPTMFISESTNGTSPVAQNQTVPGPAQFLAWNSTTTVYLNDSEPEIDLTIGGTEMKVFDRSDGGSIKYIQFETYHTFYGTFIYGEEDFVWYNASNNVLMSIRHSVYHIITLYEHDVMNMSTLDSIYAANNVSALYFELRNSRTRITVNIGFNVTEYASPSLALADKGIAISINQDFGDRETTVNVASFISGLFLFSLPGTPFPLNIMISFIIDGALIYIAFIFVLRIIGAVFGGGGA